TAVELASPRFAAVGRRGALSGRFAKPLPATPGLRPLAGGRRSGVLERAAILRRDIRRRPAAKCLTLFFKWDALGRGRPLPREELRVPALARNYSRSAVGKVQTAAAGRDGHLPANQARFANLVAGEP